MKQRYKSRVAWLYPQKPKIKNATTSFADKDTHEEEGIPFYCDVFEKTARVQEITSNMYRTVTETVVKTDADLEFNKFDRIAFIENPVNDVNSQDFNTIMNSIKKPRFVKGSKYRTKDVYEWELRIS